MQNQCTIIPGVRALVYPLARYLPLTVAVAALSPPVQVNIRGQSVRCYCDRNYVTLHSLSGFEQPPYHLVS